MSRKVQIAFVIGFVLCIYSVGAIQAVWERKNDETIQMLDIVKDTFTKPLERANAIAGLFEKLAGKLEGVAELLSRAAEAGDDGSFDWYEVESAAEEALFTVEDIRKRAVNINRHIKADTLSKPILRIDSLRAVVNEVYEACQYEDGGEAESALERAVAYADGLAERYPRRGIPDAPGLAWNAFWRHTVFSRRYLRAWEGEMEETSVCANTLRPPMQFIRYALMHDMGEKAVLGRNGWFFYKPGIEYLTYPYVRDRRSLPDTTTNIIDPSPVIMRENPITCITRFRRQLDSLGIELLVVIVPGKGSVYPDMLNESIPPEQSCKLSHSLRTIEELRDSGVAVVDLFGPFHEERMHDVQAGDSMYLAKDTHWRARGLRLCARLVADRVRQFDWYDAAWEQTEYVLDSVTVDRVGDVGAMTALPDFAVRELKLAFAVEPTPCYQVYQIRRDEEGNEVGRSLYRDDFRRSRILILGDSFSRIYQTDAPRSAGWISHLAYELSQPVASIVSDGGASTLVRQKLARKASVLHGKKLVVWEFIERDLRFGAEGWKDIALRL
ncbi:MAG: hypothetical protein GF331_01265 [Chitinivibrionales bacterium]|nr:hypothetical protein [Chitinivibrionales bacterium]